MQNTTPRYNAIDTNTPKFIGFIEKAMYLFLMIFPCGLAFAEITRVVFTYNATGSFSLSLVVITCLGFVLCIGSFCLAWKNANRDSQSGFSVWSTVVFICFAAFAIRIIFGILLNGKPENDFLSAYNGAVDPVGQAKFLSSTPYYGIYSVLLRSAMNVFNLDVPFIAMLVNSLATCLIPGILFAAVKKFTKSNYAAFVASLLYAFFPSMILYTVCVAGENISQLFMALLFLFFVLSWEAQRQQRYYHSAAYTLLACLSAALLNLFKPIGIILTIAIFAQEFIYRVIPSISLSIKLRNIRIALRSILIAFGIVILFQAMCAVTFFLSGKIIERYTKQDISSVYYGADKFAQIAFFGLSKESNGIWNQNVLDRQKAIIQESNSVEEANEKMLAILGDEIKESPSDFIQLLHRKMLISWSDEWAYGYYASVPNYDVPSVNDSPIGYYALTVIPRLYIGLLYLACIIAFIFRLFLRPLKWRREQAFIAMFFGEFTVIFLVMEAHTRYKSTFMPLLCVMAALGISELTDWSLTVANKIKNNQINLSNNKKNSANIDQDIISKDTEVKNQMHKKMQKNSLIKEYDFIALKTALISKVPKNSTFLFVAFFIWQLVIYLTLLLYQAGNGDCYVFGMEQKGAGFFSLTLGRWASDFVLKLRNYQTIPVFIILLAMGIFALTAVFLVDTFNIQKKWLACLCGFLFLSQPCIFMTLSLFTTSDLFAIPIFFSVLAAWILIKFENPWRILPATACIALCLGFYQSHYVLVVVICLFAVIFDLLDANMDVRNALKRAVTYIITGISGVVAYLLVLQIALAANHTGLAAYKGIDKLGKLNLGKSIDSMWAYIQSMYFQRESEIILKGTLINSYPYIILNILVVLAFLALVIYLIMKCKLFKSTLRIIALVVSLLAIPFAFCIIVFMAPDIIINQTISPQQSLFYILFAVAVFRFLPAEKPIAFILRIFSVALCCAMIYNYAYGSNQTSYGMKLAHARTEYTASRVAQAVDSRADWKPGDKMMYFGSPDNEIEYPDYYKAIPGVFLDINFSNYVGQTAMDRYMLEKFGMLYTRVTREEFDAMLVNPEFLSMPIYPKEGYVKKIGDIVVVRLSESLKNDIEN